MQLSLPVRRLSEADAFAYYTLRKRSTERPAHPIEPQVLRELEAGASGIAARLAGYPSSFTQVWGVFGGETLIGVAAISRERHISYGEIGVLWGVYVLPRYRGSSTSRLLIDRIIHSCSLDSRISQILAPCARDNLSGHRFLQRFGFEPMTLVMRGGSIHGQGGSFEFYRRRLA